MDSAAFSGHGPSGILLRPRFLSRYCLGLLHGDSGFGEESFYSNPGKGSPAHGVDSSALPFRPFGIRLILPWGIGLEVCPYG